MVLEIASNPDELYEGLLLQKHTFYTLQSVFLDVPTTIRAKLSSEIQFKRRSHGAPCVRQGAAGRVPH